ncbi:MULTISPECIES: universal stress protein [Rhodopseudomonas]|uniref:Universal stress protein UspA n=1 Tax=Rhodopseudomonas palustris TaxID=1076 RepID=A0A0D7EFJ6_RHOPL|nr:MULTISPECIES: universal stress protein [Rhodopseudomonas]KIZ39285.1 universal stress protein UspA [Rhodopseudomonas palustris]MDF3813851.1 universal stress protein [Rhodopseudomonas sp. BAL398]WOK15442.1 universal stress protein [Rhodopseudomonas sp. BAL398]
MTYASVMVSLAFDQANTVRLALACEIAERYQSRVIGAAASEFSAPLYFTSGEAAQKLLDEGNAKIRRRIVELEAEFRQSMGGHCRELEWRAAVEMPAKYIVQQARAADLVISGGGVRDPLCDPFAQADPADLVMQLGRPLLIVPEGPGRVDLSRVLVAWKDNPEARRAIVDALPLLRHASHVSVAAIAEAADERDAAQASVADVVDWLSRHHIVASGLVPEACGHAATQLSEIAGSTEAGVIVAGAYGHSRFREWILGGVTRHLVEQGSRAVLLSR